MHVRLGRISEARPERAIGIDSVVACINEQDIAHNFAFDWYADEVETSARRIQSLDHYFIWRIIFHHCWPNRITNHPYNREKSPVNFF